MSAIPTEGKTTEDILHLVTLKMNMHSEALDKLIEEVQNERKELRASRELLDDLIGEYDRLTERQSTQLRAMIEWFQQVKKHF